MRRIILKVTNEMEHKKEKGCWLAMKVEALENKLAGMMMMMIE